MLVKVDSPSPARMIQANRKKREWGKKKQLRMYINRERETHMIVRVRKKRNKRAPYGPVCLLVVSDGCICMCL